MYTIQKNRNTIIILAKYWHIGLISWHITRNYLIYFQKRTDSFEENIITHGHYTYRGAITLMSDVTEKRELYLLILRNNYTFIFSFKLCMINFIIIMINTNFYKQVFIRFFYFYYGQAIIVEMANSFVKELWISLSSRC